ncbi:MAG: hypothetical protein K2H47_05750 [Muribaculaceae bacterium]|nr:hypothetical protein [Muribaculaceae bacterium]
MKLLSAKTLLTAVFMTAASAMALAGTNKFSYNTPGAEQFCIGFGVADHYDVAIFVPGEPLANFNTTLKEFTITVPVNDNIDNFKMWVSTSLSNPGISRHFSGDISNEYVDVDPISGSNLGTITYTLEEPYKLTSNGVYLGYSFDVKAIDPNEEVTSYPVVATADSNPNALISRLAANFPNFEPTDQYALCCTATLEGDFVDLGAGVTCSKLYAKRGEPSQLKATLINHGIEPITSVEYTCTLDDNTQSGTLEVNVDQVLGSTYDITVPVNAISDNGDYTGTLSITKVNGEPNQSASPSCTVKAKVLERIPVHRVVAEEFSGTWCNNCPRGIAGMRLLNDTFEDFIGISYHGNDIMELKSGIPALDYVYPNVFFDRVGPGRDPYFGLDLNNLVAGRIVDEYMEATETFAPADIDVQAEWNDDETSLLITSEVTFAEVPDDGFNFRVAYVVIEDGLSGSGAAWWQRNGLSGVTALKDDPYLKEFVNAPDPIRDIVYDEVAVFATNPRGVANSLPKYNDLKDNETYTHQFEAKLSDFKNANGNQSYQNPANMHVVAMLIKQDTSSAGVICNGAKAKVPVPSAVESISAEKEVTSTEFFDLTGRRVSETAKGIVIIRQTFSDGTVKTGKIIR